MKLKYFLCFFVVMTLSICISGVWAQNLDTKDGLNFTVDSSKSGNRLASETVSKESIWVPPAAREPVIMNFDKLPGGNWLEYDCDDPTGKSKILNGILTIDSPSCHEFVLYHSNDIWHKYVDNARGWVIEASIKIDRSTKPDCTDGSALIWVNDHTNLMIVGFSTNAICLTYPDKVRYYMNTTDSFHIYRITSKGKNVKVYVDGALKINHDLSVSVGPFGTDALTFGDGVGGTKSLSYWDYFSYDIYP